MRKYNNNKNHVSNPNVARYRRRLLAASIRVALIPLLSLGPGFTQPLLAEGLPVVLRDQTGKIVPFQGAGIRAGGSFSNGAFNNRFGGQTLHIDQSAERAILNWKSFDIAKDNGVEFHQPGTSSIALNRVLGDGNARSVIDGHLTANGRVYIINQNGILFGKNARVNTHSLIASSLNIDDTVFRDIGLLNAINQPTAQAAFDSTGQSVVGDITIEAGARLTSAKNGRIMMFAPTISNAGDIESEEGEIVLAAAKDKVYLASPGENSNTRGLLVEVNTGGDVTNVGRLVAERGTVSLLGLAVNQSGLARATTSVSLNGTIRLVARDMGGAPAFDGTNGDPTTGAPPVRTPRARRAGQLTLGAGSVTEVMPDDAPATVLDASTQPLSDIKLFGEQVVLESGARVITPGGAVSVRAATAVVGDNVGVPGDADTTPAQIRIESGAVIDVSGDTQTQVSVARNFVEVEARGNELADSPLQRDGAIRGKTLTVDIRKGSPFLNTTAAAAGIERGVNERLSAGGTISLETEGRLTVADGARLDISGGSVSYSGATTSSSKLVTAGGVVLDISEADPNLLYQGVLGSELFNSAYGAFEPGYVEGKDAGKLVMTASAIDFNGTLRAAPPVGRLQRTAPAELGSRQSFARLFDQRPLGGSLDVKLRNRSVQDVVIGQDDGVMPLVNGQPAAGTAPMFIAPELLTGSGISRVRFDNGGRIILNRPLDLPVFSDLTLSGTQVLVQSDIRAPGGTVTLKANSLGIIPSDRELFDSTARVSVDGAIDVSGVWTNDSAAVNLALPSAPIVTAGGTISIASARDVVLGADSLLDVSGGAYLEDSGRLTGGDGGKIELETQRSVDLAFFTADLDLGGELRGFGLHRGGTLTLTGERVRIDQVATAASGQGFGFNGARQFDLLSGAAGQQNILSIDADSFARGGFQSFQLTARELDMTPGTRVTAVAANPLLDGAGLSRLLSQLSLSASGFNPLIAATDPLALVPTGTPLAAFTRVQVLPAYQRSPVDLALKGGSLDLGLGAAILADPGANVSLQASSSLSVDGLIAAPAGTIELTNTAGSRIWLGPNARLSAPAAVRINPIDNLGLRQGEVLAAGQVSVRAEQGSIIGAPGAAIDVDGVAALLDIGSNGMSRPTGVSGDAGEIDFFVADALLYQGSLSGQSAGQQGGQLSITLDPTLMLKALPSLSKGATSTVPLGPYRAVFADFDGALPAADDRLDDGLRNHAFVPVSQLAAGGFDALDVTVRSAVQINTTSAKPQPVTPESRSLIEFTGDMRLDFARRLRLDAAVIKTTGASLVDLNAPFVALGSTDQRVRLDDSTPLFTSDTNAQTNTRALDFTPQPGDGRLRVSGELIELAGELVTEGFGRAGPGEPGVKLLARNDVRLRGVRLDVDGQNTFDGVFRTAGDLYIEAQRVYPTTLSDFELSVTGAGGVLQIAAPAGNASPAVPLSVGGALTLNADSIRQAGWLMAPLGDLTLNAGVELQLADGSLTSTSAFGVSAPFFRTQAGGSLLLPPADPKLGNIVFVESITHPEYERLLPTQGLVLNAPAVDFGDGARIDLRGGGDIRATEFVPGTGGSRDVLLAGQGSFAIVPGVGTYAPYDPLETPAFEQLQGFSVSDTLVLDEGIDGLAAGEYAILPARYALFGGFLVTPSAGSQDLAPGSLSRRLDGAPILAGHFGVAGSNRAASRNQGFAIEDGATVRTRAAYLETPLADRYTSGALRRPQDAGLLTIDARTALQLGGRLVPGVAAGRGSQVDIVADHLSVVTQLTGGTDSVELLTAQLEQLGADTLLLGGRRSTSLQGLVITPVATAVNVDAGVDLTLPELILVGDSVTLESAPGQTSTLQSAGAATGEQETLRVAGDAAVVAVSNRRLTLQRQDVSGSATGQLSITSGVTLRSAGSLVVDVAGDIDVTGNLEAGGGLLNLGASSVSLGETGARDITGGLVLSNANLARLAGSDLRLRSDSAVSIFGNLLDPATGQAIAFQGLELDTPGVVGVDSAGAAVSLLADEIRLSNTSGTDLAAVGLTPDGGDLTVAADRFVLGDGRVALQGYRDVSVTAGSYALIAGDGELFAEAPLTIDAPIITAATGATGVFTAQDSLLTVTGADADAALPAAAGLAASLRLQGNAVSFGGRAVLPSGVLEIHQLGETDEPVAGDNLDIAAGAILDVAGVTLDFGPTQLGTPGGKIWVHADTGSVNIGPGSRFNVAASPLEGSAGEVTIASPLATANVSPDAVFTSANQGGEFTLDADRLSVGGVDTAAAFTALNDLLGDNGFSARRDVRLRHQGMLLDGQLRAHDVRMVSDTDSIVVRGTIDASGRAPDSVNENGGSILLAAGDGVDIQAGAVLRATGAADASGAPAPGTRGGRIDLVALDTDGSDPQGAQDKVNLRAGALIDVSGGPNVSAGPDERVVVAPTDPGGKVFVHTRRLDTNGDGQTDFLVLGDLDATVQGTRQADVVATHVVRDGEVIGFDSQNNPVTFDLDRDTDGNGVLDTASITAADQAAAQVEMEAFLQNAPASVGAFRVTPGLLLQSSGGLVLEDRWDFRVGKAETDPGPPGVLTLRAAGDVVLQGDLTDAFFDSTGFFSVPDRLVPATQGVDTQGNSVLSAPDSMRFQVIAGADFTSTDPMATVAGTGDLQLGENAVIRTGVNDIDVAAGNDISLSTGSAIYTGGYDRGLSQNVRDILPGTKFVDTNFFFNQQLGGGAVFPVDGGNVRVTAGGNISALTPPALPTEWLPRIGAAEQGTQGLTIGAVPTHWGVAFQRFSSGIGALGGGEVDVRAGGDFTNVALAIPANGRTIAGAVADPVFGFDVALETTEVSGGGQLRARVDGDFRGGSFLLGDGVASVRIGGSVTPGTTGEASAAYIGGDAHFNLSAGRDLTVGSILDPTVVELSPFQPAKTNDLFYTYSPTATVDVRALAGKVVLDAGTDLFIPPVLRAVSASDDLVIVGAKGLKQFPSSQGQIELLAAGDLTGPGDRGLELVQSDQEVALLASIDVPAESGLPVKSGDPKSHAAAPVHRGDSRPNLFVAKAGSIGPTDGTGVWKFDLAKASVFSAGQDLNNLRVAVQHANETDVSVFSAGRDIVQSAQRDAKGRFEVSADDAVAKYEITGPGTAQFLAGREISLGTSQGIETLGNTKNAALPDSGAGLQLLAGLGGDPAYDAFIQAFLVDVDTYQSQLDDFLSRRKIPLLNGDAVATFRSLTRREQRLLIADILFNELRESGVDAQASGSSDFSRGFAAIETLFPQQDPTGGISLLLSQVQTLDGGGIDMLVPGGFINAGAADTDIIQKGADELGIVTARAGDINVFVDGDFIVNSTRAFALQGDLTVWSSNGSIDAGKGAKTVTSVPDPITRIDPNTGQSIIEFPPAVQGSGLQGRNVFLFAPRGVINAGDAGIRALGNLTVAATAVLGADNIDVGGVSVGVPVASAGVSTSIAGASSAASSATRLAEDATGSLGGEDDAGANTPLGILSVKVMGFGDCPPDNPHCK